VLPLWVPELVLSPLPLFLHLRAAR
jgi:hypothetical protein